MKIHHGLAALVLILSVEAVDAAILKGTAINGTAGKPAAGDEVILLSLPNRAIEVGRARTASNGGFQFNVDNTPAPYLVHVIHQGVVYQNLAPAGVASVEIQVYESVKKLDGIAAMWGMQRLQTAGDKLLQVVDEITVRNASSPPRTLANDRPFEIQLPPKAELVLGKVQIGNEQPILRNPSATGEKDRYYFFISLLPGDTRFAVAYRLPYSGEALLRPMTVLPMTGLVVVLPETMKLAAESPNIFKPMQGRPGVHMYGTAPEMQSQTMAFRVVGTGRLPESGLVQFAQTHNTAHRARRQSVSTDALHAHWFMVGGFVVVPASLVVASLAYRRRRAASFSSTGT